MGLACALAFGVLCEMANAQVRADEMQPDHVFAEVSGSRIAKEGTGVDFWLEKNQLQSACSAF